MANINYKVLLKMAVMSSLMTHHGRNKSGFTALVREEWEEFKSGRNWKNRRGSLGTNRNEAGKNNNRRKTTLGDTGGNHRSEVVGETTRRKESVPWYGSKLELGGTIGLQCPWIVPPWPNCSGRTAKGDAGAEKVRKWEFRKRRKKNMIMVWRVRVQDNIGGEEVLRWEVRRRSRKKISW